MDGTHARKFLIIIVFLSILLVSIAKGFFSPLSKFCSSTENMTPPLGLIIRNDTLQAIALNWYQRLKLLIVKYLTEIGCYLKQIDVIDL